MTRFLISYPHHAPPPWCFACTEPTAPHKCSGCHAINYCSAKCQKGHWPRHKAQCELRRLITQQEMLLHPKVDDFKVEEHANGKLTLHEAALKHGFTAKDKLVFIFYTPRSPFARYFYSMQEKDVPADEPEHSVLAQTLEEFRFHDIFSVHQHVRRIVEEILAIEHKDGVWVTVDCTAEHEFAIIVRGGLYAPLEVVRKKILAASPKPQSEPAVKT